MAAPNSAVPSTTEYEDSTFFWRVRFKELCDKCESLRSEMRAGRREGGLMDAAKRAALLTRALKHKADIDEFEEEAPTRLGCVLGLGLGLGWM